MDVSQLSTFVVVDNVDSLSEVQKPLASFRSIGESLEVKPRGADA